jgi:hypothetical protein
MGAALAIKNLMLAKGTPGTLRFYGPTAEESEAAKVFMTGEGCLATSTLCSTGIIRAVGCDLYSTGSEPAPDRISTEPGLVEGRGRSLCASHSLNRALRP